jgi:hypothetical protein
VQNRIADSLSEFLAEQLDRPGRAVVCRGWSRQVAASGRAIKRQTPHRYGVEWPVPSSGETSCNRIFSRGHFSICAKRCMCAKRCIMRANRKKGAAMMVGLWPTNKSR